MPPSIKYMIVFTMLLATYKGLSQLPELGRKIQNNPDYESSSNDIGLLIFMIGMWMLVYNMYEPILYVNNLSNQIWGSIKIDSIIGIVGGVVATLVTMNMIGFNKDLYEGEYEIDRFSLEGAFKIERIREFHGKFFIAGCLLNNGTNLGGPDFSPADLDGMIYSAVEYVVSFSSSLSLY